MKIEYFFDKVVERFYKKHNGRLYFRGDGGVWYVSNWSFEEIRRYIKEITVEEMALMI